MDSTGGVVAFYILAAVILGSALMMVFMKNIVHSALYMIICFLGVAGLYLTLNAEFLAFVQVMVYAGAIGVFMMFGVMLIQRSSMKETNLYNKQKFISGLVALAFLVLSVFMLINTDWEVVSEAPVAYEVPQIAELLLMKYVVPFEVAAVLLLVAMIGAILIAKEVKKSQ